MRLGVVLCFIGCTLLVAADKQIKLEDIERDNLASEKKAALEKSRERNSPKTRPIAQGYLPPPAPVVEYSPPQYSSSPAPQFPIRYSSPSVHFTPPEPQQYAAPEQQQYAAPEPQQQAPQYTASEPQQSPHYAVTEQQQTPQYALSDAQPGQFGVQFTTQELAKYITENHLQQSTVPEQQIQYYATAQTEPQYVYVQPNYEPQSTQNAYTIQPKSSSVGGIQYVMYVTPSIQVAQAQEHYNSVELPPQAYALTQGQHVTAQLYAQAQAAAQIPTHGQETSLSEQQNYVASPQENFDSPAPQNYIPNQEQLFTPHQESIPQQNFQPDVSQHSFPASVPQQNFPASVPQQNFPASVPQQNFPASVPQQNFPASVPQQNFPASVPQQNFPASVPQPQSQSNTQKYLYSPHVPPPPSPVEHYSSHSSAVFAKPPPPPPSPPQSTESFSQHSSTGHNVAAEPFPQFLYNPKRNPTSLLDSYIPSSVQIEMFRRMKHGQSGAGPNSLQYSEKAPFGSKGAASQQYVTIVGGSNDHQGHAPAASSQYVTIVDTQRSIPMPTVNYYNTKFGRNARKPVETKHNKKTKP